MSAAAAIGTTNTTQPMVVDNAMRARTLDLKNQRTAENSKNKWQPILYASKGQIPARILVAIDPLSGAQCSLSCKQWHVLRTSNAVSKWLCYVHFKILFPTYVDSQTKEGTYWGRYQALGEIYPNARRFAFRPPTVIDFSTPSTPVQGHSAPGMVSNTWDPPQVLMVPSSIDMFATDAVMATYTRAEIFDEVDQVRTLVSRTRVQVRNVRNECTFEGDYPGIVTILKTSQFIPSLLAAGMRDGSIVLWDISDGTKIGILPFQTGDTDKSNKPIDPTGLKPLTQAVQGVLFLNKNTLRAAYNDGTICLWTWSWNARLEKVEFKVKRTQYPDFQITKLLESPDKCTTVLYGQSRQKPDGYKIWIVKDNQPIINTRRLVDAMIFLSKTQIAFAFSKAKDFCSYVSVYDLSKNEWTYLIDEIEVVSGFDLRFNRRVLAISSFKKNRRTTQLTTFIRLFDLQRKAFIQHTGRSPPDFTMIPPQHTPSEVVETTPQHPSFVTVVERLSKRVILYDFMTPGMDAFFSSDTTIPLQAKAPLTVMTSTSSASASGSGSGGGPASASSSTAPRKGASHSSLPVATKAAAATTQGGSGGSAYALAQPSASASGSGSGGGPASASSSTALRKGASHSSLSVATKAAAATTQSGSGGSAYALAQPSASASGSGSGSARASTSTATNNGAPQNRITATTKAPPTYYKNKRKREDNKDQKG